MNRKNIFNCKITYTVTPIFLKNFSLQKPNYTHEILVKWRERAQLE